MEDICIDETRSPILGCGWDGTSFGRGYQAYYGNGDGENCDRGNPSSENIDQLSMYYFDDGA